MFAVRDRQPSRPLQNKVNIPNKVMPPPPGVKASTVIVPPPIQKSNVETENRSSSDFSTFPKICPPQTEPSSSQSASVAASVDEKGGQRSISRESTSFSSITRFFGGSSFLTCGGCCALLILIPLAFNIINGGSLPGPWGGNGGGNSPSFLGPTSWPQSSSWNTADYGMGAGDWRDHPSGNQCDPFFCPSGCETNMDTCECMCGHSIPSHGQAAERVFIQPEINIGDVTRHYPGQVGGPQNIIASFLRFIFVPITFIGLLFLFCLGCRWLGREDREHRRRRR